MTEEATLPRLICSNCAAITVKDNSLITVRSTAIPGVDEVGLRCPRCAHFYHVGYEDTKTRARRKKAEQARHPSEREKLRRNFTRFYSRYQIVIAARLELITGEGQENGQAVH